MAAQNEEIRKLFIDGVNEVFTTLFNDGTTEGVYFYPQIATEKNVYQEQKFKTFGNPVLLTARVQLNMSRERNNNIVEDEYNRVVKGNATITVPLKSLMDNEIDVNEQNYFILRQGLMRYKDTFYEIQNISPTAFVEQVFLLYNFTCLEVIDMSSYIIPPDVEPDTDNEGDIQEGDVNEP